MQPTITTSGPRKLGNKAQRRHTNYKTTAGAPRVLSKLPPSRVAELLAVRSVAKMEPDAPTLTENVTVWKGDWIEESPRSGFTASDRRASELTADQLRVAEVRIYHGRKIHRKSDAEISQGIDLSPLDFDAVCPMSAGGGR